MTVEQIVVICPDCGNAIDFELFLESDDDVSAHVDEAHKDCKHALNAVRKALRPAPREKNPLRVRMGRTNRNRGASVERDLTRRLEELGFLVISQGGVGRRDKVVEYQGVRYSVEVKSQQHDAKRFEERRAYQQAERQALKDTTPLAFLRCTDGTTRPARWTVVTSDGAMPWAAWIASLEAPIPLGEQVG